MYDFCFEERLQEIESSIADYTNLKQLSSNSMISISENLLRTIENSLVIAIYSLSEQLLMDTIYNILGVRFENSERTAKDKYILKKMPLDSFSITPTINNINNELKLYFPNGKIYLPRLVSPYKEAYVKLVKARHDYAHGNKHTPNMDFDDAKKFVEYLYVHYRNLQEPRCCYIEKIKELTKKLGYYEKLSNAPL